MTRVQARADAVSGESRDGIERWLRAMPGCTVIHGHARFEAPGVLRVGDDQLSAPRIFINVGGARHRARRCLASTAYLYLTNSSLLALDRLPAHLVSSAAATSGWSSRRCTGASAPR